MMPKFNFYAVIILSHLKAANIISDHLSLIKIIAYTSILKALKLQMTPSHPMFSIFSEKN